jgi:parvulin-like peptidyl-prolyl isomerase
LSRNLGFLSGLFQPNEIDPEARNRTLLIGGLSLLVLLALALIAYGYYSDRIASRGDTVLRVGDRNFSYEYVEDRMDAAAVNGDINPSDLATSITNVVNEIQREQLIRLVAADKGVTVTPEEVAVEIHKQLSVPEGASRNQYAAALRDELQSIGLPLNRYEEMTEAQLLETKLTDSFNAEVPAEGEQVDLRIIQAASQGDADQAKQRLDAGEDFGAVAAALSKHSTASTGGAVGWVPGGLLPDDLDAAAFALNPGEHTNVLASDRGFIIFQVNGKEVRAIDENQKESLKSQAVIDAVKAKQGVVGSQNLLTTGQVQKLSGHVKVPGV